MVACLSCKGLSPGRSLCLEARRRAAYVGYGIVDSLKDRSWRFSKRSAAERMARLAADLACAKSVFGYWSSQVMLCTISSAVAPY